MSGSITQQTGEEDMALSVCDFSEVPASGTGAVVYSASTSSVQASDGHHYFPSHHQEVEVWYHTIWH